MGIKPNQLDPVPKADLAQASAPSTGAGKGAFYPKDVLGVVEAFYADDQGREIQLTRAGATSGEENTIASVGGGASVFKEKSGAELRLKTLTAGPNITLTPTADTIQISALDTGENNTGSNEGTGVGTFIGKTGINLRFRSILAGANCTVTQSGQDIVIASTGGGGSGEANTASNLGASGSRVFKQKSGVDLQFRRLIAGAGMSITENADDITFVASAGLGEANIGVNVGSGTGQVFKQKAGVNLEFKRLLAGTGISITDGVSDITIENTGGGGGGEANTASNSGTGTGIGVFKAKSGVDLVFRHIKASTGISVALSGDDVVITNTLSSGEANTASNVGTGTGTIFKQKTGVDLELRKIKAGTNVTVTVVSDDIVIDAAAGSGHLTQWLTFDGGNVRIKASGSSSDLAAVTATKDFTVASVSRLIVNRPSTVQYHSIYVSFTAAETVGRTECRIEQPDPNGATDLTTAIRPFAVRYNPATAGVGATTSTVSIAGSTVTVATTGHTGSAEQQMAVYN